MAVENTRSGRLRWRFQKDGHEYSDTTDLADTPRNRIVVGRMEQKARELVETGQTHLLKIKAIPFNEAANQFLLWARAEHREKPKTAERLSVSMTSLKRHFKRAPVHTIGPGHIEDYKTWRRMDHRIREITLRNDLMALRKFFAYAIKKQWCRTSPLVGVTMPSAKDAIRIHVISDDEEKRYFEMCRTLEREAAERFRSQQGSVRLPNGKARSWQGSFFEYGEDGVAKRRYVSLGKACEISEAQARAKLLSIIKEIAGTPRSLGCQYRDLHDLTRLMLLQGCRPEELLALRKEHVDLIDGYLQIVDGKTNAAKRRLRLRAGSRAILAARMSLEGPFLFPGETPNRPRTKLNAAHWDVIERAGLRFVPYDFRHTFATRAAEGGMDVPTLAAILGHSDIRVVKNYVHIRQGHMDRQMDRLDGGEGAAKTRSGFDPVSGGKYGEETGKARDFSGAAGNPPNPLKTGAND